MGNVQFSFDSNVYLNSHYLNYFQNMNVTMPYIFGNEQLNNRSVLKANSFFEHIIGNDIAISNTLLIFSKSTLRRCNFLHADYKQNFMQA